MPMLEMTTTLPITNPCGKAVLIVTTFPDCDAETIAGSDAGGVTTPEITPV